MQSAIEKALRAAGLEYKPVRIYKTDSSSGETIPAIMVYHNYEGPYPTRETWLKIYDVKRIAARHHLRRETRGYYTATLIYLEEKKPAPVKCEICGKEIIFGMNGCTMAGRKCFSCRPWNMRTVYSTEIPYNEDDARIIENRALDMGGPMPD